jgi:hypothetical protein
MNQQVILGGIVAAIVVIFILSQTPIVQQDGTYWAWSDEKNSDGIHDDYMDTRIALADIPDNNIVKKSSPAKLHLYWQSMEMGTYSRNSINSQGGDLKLEYCVYYGTDRSQGVHIGITSWPCDEYPDIVVGDESWPVGTYYMEFWTCCGASYGIECQDIELTVTVVEG